MSLQSHLLFFLRANIEGETTPRSFVRSIEICVKNDRIQGDEEKRR